MNKHTPGPWQAVAGPSRWNVTTCAKPRTFNVCAINTDLVGQESTARLIAAAPDLLEALESVSRFLADLNAGEWINGHDVGFRNLVRQRAVAQQEQVLAAIAKVNG